MSQSAGDQVNQIPDSMQAVICHGPENYQLEEVAVPRPGPGEALIKVEATGICASDLKCYHGAAKFWGDETGQPGPKQRSFPATSLSERLFSLMTRPPIAGELQSATALLLSRSCPAGSVATA